MTKTACRRLFACGFFVVLGKNFVKVRESQKIF